MAPAATAAKAEGQPKTGLSTPGVVVTEEMAAMAWPPEVTAAPADWVD